MLRELTLTQSESGCRVVLKKNAEELSGKKREKKSSQPVSGPVCREEMGPEQVVAMNQSPCEEEEEQIAEIQTLVQDWD